MRRWCFLFDPFPQFFISTNKLFGHKLQYCITMPRLFWFFFLYNISLTYITGSNSCTISFYWNIMRNLIVLRVVLVSMYSPILPTLALGWSKEGRLNLGFCRRRIGIIGWECVAKKCLEVITFNPLSIFPICLQASS